MQFFVNTTSFIASICDPLSSIWNFTDTLEYRTITEKVDTGFRQLAQACHTFPIDESTLREVCVHDITLSNEAIEGLNTIVCKNKFSLCLDRMQRVYDGWLNNPIQAIADGTVLFAAGIGTGFALRRAYCALEDGKYTTMGKWIFCSALTSYVAVEQFRKMFPIL